MLRKQKILIVVFPLLRNNSKNNFKFKNGHTKNFSTSSARHVWWKTFLKKAGVNKETPIVHPLTGLPREVNYENKSAILNWLSELTKTRESSVRGNWYNEIILADNQMLHLAGTLLNREFKSKQELFNFSESSNNNSTFEPSMVNPSLNLGTIDAELANKHLKKVLELLKKNEEILSGLKINDLTQTSLNFKNSMMEISDLKNNVKKEIPTVFNYLKNNGAFKESNLTLTSAEDIDIFNF